MQCGSLPVTEFIGKVLKGVTIGEDYITFVSDDGKKYEMYHNQDCCEDVRINEICGNVEDLIGYTILESEEEIIEDEIPPNFKIDKDIHLESFTWSVHRFRTEKGYLEVRWLGRSNGYYSEGVYLGEEK